MKRSFFLPFFFFSTALKAAGAYARKAASSLPFSGISLTIPGSEARFSERFPLFLASFSQSSQARFSERLHSFLEASTHLVFGSFAPSNSKVQRRAWWTARSAVHLSPLFFFVHWCFALLLHCFTVTLLYFNSSSTKPTAGSVDSGLFWLFRQFFGNFDENFPIFVDFSRNSWCLVSPDTWWDSDRCALSSYQFGFLFGYYYTMNASCERKCKHSPLAPVTLFVWSFGLVANMAQFCWYFGGMIACAQALFSQNASFKRLLEQTAAHSHTAARKSPKNQLLRHSENNRKWSNSYSFNSSTFSRVRCRMLCHFYSSLTHFGIARCGFVKIGPAGPKTVELQSLWAQVQLHQSPCCAPEVTCKKELSKSSFFPALPQLLSLQSLWGCTRFPLTQARSWWISTTTPCLLLAESAQLFTVKQ